jgi:hypothetical protein
VAEVVRGVALRVEFSKWPGEADRPWSAILGGEAMQVNVCVKRVVPQFEISLRALRLFFAYLAPKAFQSKNKKIFNAKCARETREVRKEIKVRHCR